MWRRLFPLALVELCLCLSTPVPASAQVISTFGPLAGNPNIWTGSNSYVNGIQLGPVTVSKLSSLVGLSTVIVVSDGTPGSSPCTGGGTGALAAYYNSQWNCLNGSGSVGNTITVNGGSALGSPTNFQNGTSTTVTNPSGNNVQVNVTGTTIPCTPQTGDTLRQNVYGDSAWDCTNAAAGRIVTVYYGYLNNTWNVTSSVSTVNTLGTSSFTNPSATDQGGGSLTSSASASTSTVIGITQGIGANSAEYGFGSFYRWSMRFAAGNTTNVRYWLGLTAFNTGGSGCETAQPLNSTRFAANAPNCTTLAFRYSAGTDTAWQCTSQVTGGSQTVTTTGQAIDTSNHTFEITYDGTNERCFIDGALKATVNTNTPAGSTFHMLQFWSGDNENTTTAISGITYWTALALK